MYMVESKESIHLLIQFKVAVSLQGTLAGNSGQNTNPSQGTDHNTSLHRHIFGLLEEPAG